MYYKDTFKQPDELENDYILRLYCIKKQKHWTWQNIADIANAELNYEYSASRYESACRRLRTKNVSSATRDKLNGKQRKPKEQKTTAETKVKIKSSSSMKAIMTRFGKMYIDEFTELAKNGKIILYDGDKKCASDYWTEQMFAESAKEELTTEEDIYDWICEGMSEDKLLEPMLYCCTRRDVVSVGKKKDYDKILKKFGNSRKNRIIRVGEHYVVLNR